MRTQWIGLYLNHVLIKLSVDRLYTLWNYVSLINAFSK